MKYKAIEKIPYLEAQKTADKKRFVAAVAVREIHGEQILIIDIYKNYKKYLKKPLVRICITEKEWGNWFPDNGYWTESGIENVMVNDRHFFKWNTTSITREQESVILQFINSSRNNDWWNGIRHYQAEINGRKREKRTERRYEALEERIRNMPQIPEDFYHWCEDVLFKNDRYIFYRRKGRFAEFHCACCGGNYTYATAQKDTFEGQFEHIGEVPRQGQKGKCETCGEEAVYKAIGRGDIIEDKRRCYMIQPYGDKGGAVVRYFEIHKISRKGNGPVYEDIEINRCFFTPGMKKIQKDWCVYNPWDCTNQWIPNNISGMNTLTTSDAPLYPGSSVVGTMLEYSGIKEYEADHIWFRADKYMEAYINTPQLEMIVKMGLAELAERIVNGYGVCNAINTDGKTAAEVLMISKCKMKQLIKHRGNRTIHDILRIECEMGIDLKSEDEEGLALLDMTYTDMKTMLGYMTARKLINRVYQYSGVELEATKGLPCGAEVGILRKFANMYTDYIELRRDNGYDMENEIYLHPHDLKAEHDKMVMESSKKEAEKRIKEVCGKFNKIAEMYGMLCGKYEYSDDTFCIRPAKDAAEIVTEGRVLHHCVGGDGYLTKHMNGDSTILFLRPIHAKDIPFVTVEVTEFRIIQWHGEYNQQPCKAKIEKWLKAYLKMAEKGILHMEQKDRTALLTQTA